METNKNVGRYAESRLDTICSKAGIVCNRSSNDLKGWDFVVEPEAVDEQLLPEDRKIGHPKYFVQVKGSYTNQTAPITLSNAKIMANDPNPFFVIFFRYDNNLECEQIYGVHIWEDEIFRILKRLRNFSQNGDGSLNKKTIIFKFTEDQKIEGDLIEWMKCQVGNLASYHERKKLLIATVGNEGLKVSFEVDMKKLVDLSLGKIDELQVKDGVTIIDRRFGIESEIRISGWARFRINFRDNLSVTMRISNSEGDSVNFVTQVFPPIVTGLSQSDYKVRFKNELVSFVTSYGDSGSLVIEDLEIEAFNNANDLETLSKLVRVLEWTKSGPVTHEMYSNGKKLLGGSLNLNSGLLKLEQILATHSILTAMKSICEAHKEVLLGLSELLQMAEDPKHQSAQFSEKLFRIAYDEILDDSFIPKFALYPVGIIRSGEAYLGIIRRDVEAWNFPINDEFGISLADPKWLKTKHMTYPSTGLSKAEFDKLNAEKDEFFKEGFDELISNYVHQEFGLLRLCFEKIDLLETQER